MSLPHGLDVLVLLEIKLKLLQFEIKLKLLQFLCPPRGIVLQSRGLADHSLGNSARAEALVFDIWSCCCRRRRSLHARRHWAAGLRVDVGLQNEERRFGTRRLGNLTDWRTGGESRYLCIIDRTGKIEREPGKDFHRELDPMPGIREQPGSKPEVACTTRSAARVRPGASSSINMLLNQAART